MAFNSKQLNLFDLTKSCALLKLYTDACLYCVFWNWHKVQSSNKSCVSKSLKICILQCKVNQTVDTTVIWNSYTLITHQQIGYKQFYKNKYTYEVSVLIRLRITGKIRRKIRRMRYRVKLNIPGTLGSHVNSLHAWIKTLGSIQVCSKKIIRKTFLRYMSGKRTRVK